MASPDPASKPPTKLPRVDEHPKSLIGARLKGPGPGVYFLPGTVGFIRHDPTKRQAPGVKHGVKPVDTWETFKLKSSPGPKYAVDPKVTKFGRGDAPYFSIQGRPEKPLSNKNSNPSPDKYRPEDYKRTTSLACSIKSRTKRRAVDKVPPPNAYRLPPLIGPKRPHLGATVPGTSMANRRNLGSFKEDLFNTPAPGKYSSVDPCCTHQPGAAKYSIAGRHPLPKPESHKQPGPGQHSAEKVTAHKPSAPQFTMGQRHSEFILPTNCL